MSEICKIIRESGCICGNGQKSGYITAIMINRRDFQRSGVLMDDERSCVQIRPEHVQTSPNPPKNWRKVVKGWSSLDGGNVNEHDIYHFNALWGCYGRQMCISRLWVRCRNRRLVWWLYADGRGMMDDVGCWWVDAMGMGCRPTDPKGVGVSTTRTRYSRKRHTRANDVWL